MSEILSFVASKKTPLKDSGADDDELSPAGSTTRISDENLQKDQGGGDDRVNKNSDQTTQNPRTVSPCSPESHKKDEVQHLQLSQHLSHDQFEALWPYCPFHFFQPEEYSSENWKACRTRNQAISHVVAHLRRRHGLIRGVHHQGAGNGKKYLAKCTLYDMELSSDRVPCAKCHRVVQWTRTELKDYHEEHSGPSMCLRCYAPFHTRKALWHHLHASTLCLDREKRLSKTEKAMALYSTFCSMDAIPRWAPPPTEDLANTQAVYPCVPTSAPAPAPAVATTSQSAYGKSWSNQGGSRNEVFPINRSDIQHKIGDYMVLSHDSLGNIGREQSFAVLSQDQLRSECIEAVSLARGAPNTCILASNLDSAPAIGPDPDRIGDLQALSLPGVEACSQNSAIATWQSTLNFDDDVPMSFDTALPAMPTSFEPQELERDSEDWLEFLNTE